VNLEIVVVDPTVPEIAALIATHLEFARAQSPLVDVHALSADGLASVDITFCVARLDAGLVGMGAIRWLADAHGELKSMHTIESVRGRGVGRAILDHLVELAKDQGCTRVSLETGSIDAMAPARAMYMAAGFVECPPFGDYPGGPNSVCMTRTLDA
jgi:putative acetyltransferase